MVANTQFQSPAVSADERSLRIPRIQSFGLIVKARGIQDFPVALNVTRVIRQHDVPRRGHTIGQRFPEAETRVSVAIHPLVSTAGPDWAPDKLSSFESSRGDCTRSTSSDPSSPPFEPVSSVNVYLASPVCGVEGYKLEATPLMIQKGPRYVRLSSSRRASFAIYRLPLFAFFLLSFSL